MPARPAAPAAAVVDYLKADRRRTPASGRLDSNAISSSSSRRRARFIMRLSSCQFTPPATRRDATVELCRVAGGVNWLSGFDGPTQHEIVVLFRRRSFQPISSPVPRKRARFIRDSSVASSRSRSRSVVVVVERTATMKRRATSICLTLAANCVSETRPGLCRECM